MKKLNFIKTALLLSAMSVFMYQCKKEDVVEQKDSTISYGTDVVDTYAKDSQDSIWDMEDHSRLLAEFQYYGEAVKFEAEFILWDMELKFDEATPENSKIEAVVHTRSIQTGAPAGTEILKKADGITDSVVTTSGRDGEIFACAAFYVKASEEAGIVGRKFQKDFFLNGCLTKPKGTSPNYTASTLGITTDGTKDSRGRFLPSGVSDKATFKSTSVERYGNGYLAKGTFTWNGKTQEVELKFKYIPAGSHKYRSFEGEFSFAAFTDNATSDDFIIDSHVQGDATVKVHAMFQKKKA